MIGKIARRTQRIIMDDFDDAMLSFALRDAFENVVFVKRISLLRRPVLDTADTIPECDGTVLHALFPEPGWHPIILPDEPPGNFFSLANAPHRRVFYRRTRWFWGDPWVDDSRWAFSIPTPESEDFVIEFDREQDDGTFARQVLRILNQLTTNRMKNCHPHSGTVYAHETTSSYRRAGHHVLEWCHEPYDRMIDGCLRPTDDWQPPDTPWHRDLRHRVIERFGTDFGVPPRLERVYHEGPFAHPVPFPTR